jgi:putative radical SAM enzyme (TIGR03279 family)
MELGMGSLITYIDEKSPAGGKNIRSGDKLVRINGHKIKDVLDYKYYSYDARLLLEIHDPQGRIKLVRVNKPEGADLGLTFETYLMDRARSCANKCVFCFVDQLPKGLRETLYFKDDDNRLSFLQGNYVTLTNLSDKEIQRMIDMRLGPLNLSVHSTDPELHSLLLGNKKSARGLEAMQRFKEAGMAMNCQIVCCPGLNDGEQLDRTMSDLADMYPAVKSVSVVPVGLTKYREGLYSLKSFNLELARKTVRQTEHYGEKCLKKFGTRLFYPADELYLKAEMDIPDDRFYEDYPQLENGVGMLRLLMTQTEKALRVPLTAPKTPFSIATGAAASKCLQKILNSAAEKCANISGAVYAIRNDFFGSSVDVAGLLTGGDLIRQLKGRDLGARLLITKNMLRHGENVFLDDVTLQEVSRELGVSIRVVGQDGADLIRAIFGN